MSDPQTNSPPPLLLTREAIERMRNGQLTKIGKETLCDMALAYLDTLADSKTPQGWQLVPVYMTDEMVLASEKRQNIKLKWEEILRAAPTLSAKDNKNEQ